VIPVTPISQTIPALAKYDAVLASNGVLSLCQNHDNGMHVRGVLTTALKGTETPIDAQTQRFTTPRGWTFYFIERQGTESLGLAIVTAVDFDLLQGRMVRFVEWDRRARRNAVQN
jgi:hypothetical protein